MNDTTFTLQTEAALAAVKEERRCLKIEQAAFGQFRKRVAEMDPNPSDSSIRGTQIKNTIIGSLATSVSGTQIEKIREAYKETVMGVPHYEDDYGHSLEDNLAIEFSSELATTLTTADSLTPSLKETLLSASQQASEKRVTLLNTLNHEAENLQRAREAFKEMNSILTEMNEQPLAAWSQHEIFSGYDQIQEFETGCDELASDRQTELRSRRSHEVNYDHEEFTEYLYEALPVTYPVLTDIAELNSLLQTARRRLERVLINQ